MANRLDRELSEILRGQVPMLDVSEPPRVIENTNLQLRDYQQECLDKIVQAYADGVSRQLIALPTGTGKTVIFSQLPSLFPGKAVLVIAHREELLEQAAEKIEWANPDLGIEIEQANRKASKHADVVVGSIQSLSGQHGKSRLERIEPDRFGTIVIDEAHHAPASTYIDLLARFGKMPDLTDIRNLSGNQLNRALALACAGFHPDPSGPLLVGFTATPHRTDGVGLQYVFDEIPFSRTIMEMMTAPAPGPWLCDIRGYTFETHLSLDGVKTRMGDYQASQLAERIDVEGRNVAAVRAYMALASGRQAICFCVDVAHARNMLDQFRMHGVVAGCVVGSDTADHRNEVVSQYKSGELEVLSNCMVFTEGFDHAATSCIIMCRPTKSQLLYTQMLGRGTRICPGKKDLLVIDLADTDNIGVASVNTLFGLPPKMETKSAGVIETQREFEELVEDAQVDPGMMDEVKTIEEVRQLARDYNPLGIPRMPGEIRCQLVWAKTPYGYVLNVNNDLSFGVSIDLLGHAAVQAKRREPGEPSRTSSVSEFGHGYESAQAAITAVEIMVKGEYQQEFGLLNKNAAWRRKAQGEEASQAQLDYLRHLGVRCSPDISKADASALIANAVARRSFQKEEGE